MDRLLSCFSWVPCLAADLKARKPPLTVVERKLARDLYDACWDGDVMGCIDLLDKGASPNEPFGLRNATALHAASKIGNLAIVTAILKHKPDLKIKDTDGLTALAIAAKAGSREIAEAIRKST